ncbi:MAG: hypothetical protein LBT56_05095 [Prevotellaceae bacterium]|jgi:hypothetical protein|nr:hypothetical protein [Prevotellaceae bacterium]
MKKTNNTDNSIIKNYKSKTAQVGSITTFADDDFLTTGNETPFTAAIIGITKNADKKTFLNIRKEFYNLYQSNNIQILDLENVEYDENKIKNLISDITKKKLNTVFLCENDEISASLLNIRQARYTSTVVVLPDITMSNKHIAKLISKTKNEIAIIGYQNYFSNKTTINKLNKNNCITMRLSEYRSEPNNIEPILRDSNFIAIDIAAVRHSDGGTTFSPNGLYAEELCAIANYAGLSNKISHLNIVCGQSDNAVTNNLTAQTIWHFADGLANRIVETPKKIKFKKFIVDMGNSSTNLIFYKSIITNRWWLEVSNGNKTKTIACTFADYQKACNKDIPIRWIKEMQKMS